MASNRDFFSRVRKVILITGAVAALVFICAKAEVDKIILELLLYHKFVQRLSSYQINIWNCMISISRR